MAYSKLALKRNPDIPAGQPSPMHLDCPCGQEVLVDTDLNRCVCGAEYDRRGYVVTSSIASNTEQSSRYGRN